MDDAAARVTDLPGGDDPLAPWIARHVGMLCAVGPDRHPGTEPNRRAVAYVSEVLGSLGLRVESLPFETVEWLRGGARVTVGDLTIEAHPGPFSPPIEASAPLARASSAEELVGLDAAGCILLVHGPLAAAQLTPRGYPWYSDPEHAAILDAIDRLAPLAVLAATGTSAMTAALSPFPLIEDPDVSIPSAYVTVEEGDALLGRVGETVTMSIDSWTRPATGEQPVARLAGAGRGRVVIAAHIDTKPDTPGALDNAAGVATLLAVAALLAEDAPGPSVEFVPFNGEDHAAAPGEVAYFAAFPDLGDVVLMVNIDAAGLRGGPSGVSLYGMPETIETLVTERLAAHSRVTRGPEWFASDHAIFAMRGVPSIAVTSSDFTTILETIAHTPLDTPDLVDAEVLEDTARFIAEVVRALG